MNTTELLGVFRQEVADVELPYLWSDALVYTYIDDAQKQFCRWTYGIADSRSFKLSIKPATDWYKTDPRILKLRSAQDAVTGLDIPIVPSEKMADRGMRFDGRVGTPRAIVPDLDDNLLRIWPLPNALGTLTLRTFRLPTTVAAGDDFEVRDEHQLNLLLWVKHRAYSVQDSETTDKRKAAEYREAFMAYCAAAKLEQDRLLRPTGTVTYGGI